jgi:WD40 repeat protein
MFWCLHSNEVIFSFLGHSDLITDITMNPVDDTFLTTSRDKTSRLWDLSKRNCLCIFQDSNYATFDDSGKVIASVTSENDKSSDKIINYINLYASDSVLKGPFKVFKIENATSEIKQLKFSNDGVFIMCTTSDNVIFLIDAYEGTQLAKLTGEINENDLYIKADISADSKFIASGSESGNVLIWNTSGELIINLDCHPETSYCVKFSPKYALLATSCTNLVLWHPSKLE